MPLTEAGKKVKKNMESTYGTKGAQRVFYASINKGKPGSKNWHVKAKARRAAARGVGRQG